jgi:dihydroorotase
MIDPHVHLRDWNQADKETLRHGLSVAWRAGLDGVFEMPNTDPPLTSREAILRRIGDADRAIRELGVPIFHGIYAGLTADPAQIEGVVKAWRELFPRVVGLKMFAGHSTGNMGIIAREKQALVYKKLAELKYTGVLAVHCEKEDLLKKLPDGKPDWDPASPATHCQARPPAAEVASVNDQKELARAAGFAGTLHIAHISTPWALDLLRGRHAPSEPLAFRITCGLTPHHALLDETRMDGPKGLLLKANPPLRPSPMPSMMLARLTKGEIDWIETDHAPHTLKDKTEGYASGIPGLPYYPRFMDLLRARGLSEAWIDALCHDAVCRAFGVNIPNRRRKPDLGLASEYPWNPFEGIAAEGSGDRKPSTERK